MEVTSPLQQALSAERVRSARLLNLLRFVGVSAFLALVLIAGVILRQHDWQQTNLRFFFVYWALAGLVWLVGRRSPTVARLAGLSIPLVDMPAVSVLLWGVSRIIGDPGPGYIFASNATFLVLLIVGSLAALHTREVLLAAVVAIGIQTLFGVRAGIPVLSIAFLNLIMVFAIVGCIYIIRRVTALVGDVTAAQVRRERLSRYFSPQVAAMLAEEPAEQSAGESREVTVLFSDLRDFTALAERLYGAEVVALLNAYHERMVRTIFAFGGTLDKFLGDGLMVYFGAPVTQPDHAARAVRCALAMQQELARWNGERAARTEPTLHMGIGIHTGTVVLGSIGTAQRREYTVVGDTVNVAARLQELTKTVPAPVLVSEVTRRALGGGTSVVAAGLVQLRGRAQPLEAYRVDSVADRTS